MSDRETKRCPHCELNQFVIGVRLCRRCKQPIDLPVKPEAVMPPVESLPALEAESVTGSIAQRIVQYRRARLWSQKQLAHRMGVPRTYISKLERGHAIPTLGSLSKLATALELPMARFLDHAPLTATAPPQGFLAEMATFVPQLTDAQLRSILNIAAKLARVQKERAA